MLFDFVVKVIVMNEVNVLMGVICVILMVGSVGVVLGVFFFLKDCLEMLCEDMVNFLFIVGVFGYVVVNNVFISGVVGGC